MCEIKITSTNYVPIIYINVTTKCVITKSNLKKFIHAQIDKLEFPRPDLCQASKE